MASANIYNLKQVDYSAKLKGAHHAFASITIALFSVDYSEILAEVKRQEPPILLAKAPSVYSCSNSSSSFPQF